jgi:hypothetical protein
MAEAITNIITDQDVTIVKTCAVVIYAPAGKTRKRFPENCVTVYPGEAAALAAALPDKGYHAAIASGPSRSSEGFRLYY